MRAVFTGYIVPLVVASVLFAGLVTFVFPTTTWLDQRAEAIELDQALTELTAEQLQLRNSIADMRTPAQIERIARRDFNLVFPGEEAFALLPAPAAAVKIPASWPFSILHGESID